MQLYLEYFIFPFIVYCFLYLYQSFSYLFLFKQEDSTSLIYLAVAPDMIFSSSNSHDTGHHFILQIRIMFSLNHFLYIYYTKLYLPGFYQVF